MGARDDQWLDLVAAQQGGPEDWRSLARRGGFPVPAVHQETDLQRRIWFDGYVQTYLERARHRSRPTLTNETSCSSNTPVPS